MLNIKRFAGLQTKEGVVYTTFNLSPQVEIEPGVFEYTQEYDDIYVWSKPYKKKDISMEELADFSMFSQIPDSDFPF